MSNVRIELNSAGIRDLLRSNEMQQFLETQAKSIAKRAGEECEVYVAQTRGVAEVRTTGTQGNKNNKMIKALK